MPEQIGNRGTEGGLPVAEGAAGARVQDDAPARETSEREILVDNLTFAYPESGRDALDAIDLEFRQGDLCAILGRNGSGKSTLARCLNALLLPTSGRVVSCGFDTSDASHVKSIRQKLSMVFQNPDTQIVGITVEEEVAFGPENLGLSTREIRQRVDRALEVVGISGLVKRQPLRLSQGQKQLVAIAGALAMEPAFLISDESTSMLDHAARKRILDVFVGLRERGVGVVHVTHFLEEASLADRVVVLDKGRVAAQGPPGAVLGDPDAVRGLGLDPLPVTLVARELEKTGHPTPPGILTVKELLEWLPF
jgi:energy-coupling factor transport system ATP-binding protein